MITIPMVVTVISGAVWLLAEGMLSADRSSDQWLRAWVIDVCRILFAASALVVLWHVAGKPVL